MTDVLKHAIAEGRLLIVYWEDWSSIDAEGNPSLKHKIFTTKDSGCALEALGPLKLLKLEDSVSERGHRVDLRYAVTPENIRTYGTKVADETDAMAMREDFIRVARELKAFRADPNFTEVASIVSKELV